MVYTEGHLHLQRRRVWKYLPYNLYYCCAVRDSSSIRTEASHLVSRLKCCYLPDVLIMCPCDVVGSHRVCSSRMSGLHFRQPIVAEAYELIMDSDYSRSL